MFRVINVIALAVISAMTDRCSQCSNGFQNFSVRREGECPRAVGARNGRVQTLPDERPLPCGADQTAKRKRTKRDLLGVVAFFKSRSGNSEEETN